MKTLQAKRAIISINNFKNSTMLLFQPIINFFSKLIYFNIPTFYFYFISSNFFKGNTTFNILQPFL